MEWLEWILANKTWIFSGVGVAVPVAVIGWIFQKRVRVGKQELTSGDSSAGVFQTGGDFTVHNLNINTPVQNQQRADEEDEEGFEREETYLLLTAANEGGLILISHHTHKVGRLEFDLDDSDDEITFEQFKEVMKSLCKRNYFEHRSKHSQGNIYKLTISGKKKAKELKEAGANLQLIEQEFCEGRDEEELEEIDIKLLKELAVKYPPGHKKLARSIGINPEKILHYIERLEGKGYVESGTSTYDDGEYYHLTQKGRRYILPFA